MPTGRIEILGNELKVLNASETPPIQLDEHAEVGEKTLGSNIVTSICVALKWQRGLDFAQRSGT